MKVTFTKNNQTVYKTRFENYGCINYLLIVPMGIGLFLGILVLAKSGDNFQATLWQFGVMLITILAVLGMFYWIEAKLNSFTVRVEDIQGRQLRYGFGHDFSRRGYPQRAWVGLPRKRIYLFPDRFDRLKTFLESQGVTLVRQ